MKFQLFNKTTSYRKFDYSPMYYDERKERLDLKKKQFESLESENLTEDQRRTMLRNSMQESWQFSRNQKVSRNSSMRVLILIGLIVALGYFIFNGLDDIDTVIHKIW